MRLKYLAASLVAVPGLFLFALLGAKGINTGSGTLKFLALLAFIAVAIAVSAILQEPNATKEKRH